MERGPGGSQGYIFSREHVREFALVIQGVNKNLRPKTRTQKELSLISEEIQQNLTVLSRPHAKVLAKIVYGMLHTGSCSQTQIAHFLEQRNLGDFATIKQCLARWTKGTVKTKTPEQCEYRSVAASLMAWILRKWPSQQMALAIDMTHLSDKWISMVVTVLYGQVGIPVNWRMFRADEKFDGKANWISMLRELKPAVREDIDVLVLSDRGLWSPDLFREIQQLGWHPFMRVSGQGCFTPDHGSDSIHYLRDLVKTPGKHREMCGVAYAKAKVSCTALAAWDPGHKQPWIVLTDLPPDHELIRFYGLRNWCEQTFKVLKRGGFGWHKTRMTDPHRAERMWLAFAVTMFWSVLIGVRKGRRLKSCPISTRSHTKHRLPTEHNFRALVARGLDIVRASMCSLLDLLAERLPMPTWHIRSTSFKLAKNL